MKDLVIFGNLGKKKRRIVDLLKDELNDYKLSFFDRYDNAQQESLKLTSDQVKILICNSAKDLDQPNNYQFVFDNTDLAVFYVNPSTGKFVDANKAAQTLCKRDVSELKKLQTKSVYEKEKPKVKDQKNSKYFVYSLPNGEKVIVKHNILCIDDEMLFFIAEEIKVKKQAVEYESEQERMYNTLVNNLPGFVYQCKNDSDWTMISISNACQAITGYPPAYFNKNKLNTYNSIIQKDFQSLVRDRMQLALNDKEVFDYNYPIKTINGRLVWVKERAVGVYNEQGKLTHIEGYVRDVTESVRFRQIQTAIFNISKAVMNSKGMEKLLFEVKKELSTIIDTTNFYIALYDDKKDVFSLPFFTDQKDQLSEIPAGKTLTKYVVKTKQSLLASENLLQKLVAEGQIEFMGTLSKIWLGVPLRVEHEIIGVLAVQSYENASAFNDTDLSMLEFVSTQIGLSIKIKRKEEELRTALKRAEESDRLKSSFLANMSHEIRTPMNGILGFAEVLQEDDLSFDERHRFLKIIDKSGHRMLNIINDLIDVSKVDAGLMDVNITGVDLYEVTAYLHSFFLTEAESKGIHLIVNHPNVEKTLLVQTDGEKLYAILTNLLKNAIKYSEKGTITYGYKENNGQMEFYVKDQGVGIPDEKKGDVFRRFVQLNKTTDPFTEGSGLGLSITKAYVELLNGKIWFESKEEIGSEFYFVLPNLM